MPEQNKQETGWRFLRRELVLALAGDQPQRLERSVSASVRSRLAERLALQIDLLAEEAPAVTVISTTALGPGSRLYTVRERRPSALAAVLFEPPCLLEADIQVTGGSDWIVRDLRPAAAPSALAWLDEHVQTPAGSRAITRAQYLKRFRPRRAS
jgi:hypothetical protein